MKLTLNVTIVVIVVLIVVGLFLPTQGGRPQHTFLVENDKKCETYTKCNNRSDSSTHSSRTISAYSRWKSLAYLFGRD